MQTIQGHGRTASAASAGVPRGPATEGRVPGLSHSRARCRGSATAGRVPGAGAQPQRVGCRGPATVGRVLRLSRSGSGAPPVCATGPVMCSAAAGTTSAATAGGIQSSAGSGRQPGPQQPEQFQGYGQQPAPRAPASTTACLTAPQNRGASARHVLTLPTLLSRLIVLWPCLALWKDSTLTWAYQPRPGFTQPPGSTLTPSKWANPSARTHPSVDGAVPSLAWAPIKGSATQQDVAASYCLPRDSTTVSFWSVLKFRNLKSRLFLRTSLLLLIESPIC